MYQIILLFFLGLCFAVVSTASGDDPPITTTVTVTQTTTVVSKFQNRSAHWWAQHTWYWKREAINRGNILRHDPNVIEAINLACVIYGNCPTLWRKADCETGGTFNPKSKNSKSSARGLFQFLTEPPWGSLYGGTWATTPFRKFSVFSPYANALAAGWMHIKGRGGEWVCR